MCVICAPQLWMLLFLPNAVTQRLGHTERRSSHHKTKLWPCVHCFSKPNCRCVFFSTADVSPSIHCLAFTSSQMLRSPSRVCTPSLCCLSGLKPAIHLSLISLQRKNFPVICHFVSAALSQPAFCTNRQFKWWFLRSHMSMKRIYLPEPSIPRHNGNELKVQPVVL